MLLGVLPVHLRGQYSLNLFKGLVTDERLVGSWVFDSLVDHNSLVIWIGEHLEQGLHRDQL